MDNLKYCVNCKRWQDISKFHKNKSTKDRLSNWCKTCNNGYTKAKYTNDIESERERCRKSSTKYRETHKEKIMQQREQTKDYQKEYRGKNKDLLAEYAAEYRFNNRLAISKNKKKWKERNAEHVKNKRKVYYLKNREVINKKALEYHKNNPDVARKAYAKRKFLKKHLSIGYRISYQKIRERDKGICHICGRNVAPNEMEFDHIVPLCKGGEHSERNIAVCHKICNRQKSTNIFSLTKADLIPDLLSRVKIIDGIG